MPNLVQNVIAGKPLATGGIYVAPMGTALPTDTTTALDPAFVSLGYISEEGVSESMSRDTSKVKAWGGDVVKIVQSEHSVTYSYSMIESASAAVLKEVYGEENVTFTAATTTAGNQTVARVTSEQLPHLVRVVEIKDGDARIRIVLPDSQITEQGDITYADADVIAYPVTLEAFADPADGVTKAYKYADDGKKDA